MALHYARAGRHRLPEPHPLRRHQGAGLIAYDHDGGEGGDAMHAFKAVVTLAAENLKIRGVAMAKFGAIEGGNQTFARLESYLAKA
jgi:hypothetical protein